MRLRCITLFFLWTVTAWGHPHSFVDLSVTVEMQGDRVGTLTQKWLYDEMTSSILMMEFDADGNGVLDDAETAFVRENYLDAIIESGYFNHITAGGKAVATPPARFELALEKGRIAYLFIFDYSQVARDLPLAVSFYDAENFIAFEMKKGGVRLLPERSDLKAEAVLKDYVYTLKVEKR